jgi:segregation and condensation protein A
VAYSVQLINFDGPLDLLLQLVERAELAVTEISLADLTDQYLTHINQLVDPPAEELNQFIELAAKLVLIKSQALLPDSPPEAESATAELVAQLAEYRRYQGAADQLRQLLAAGRYSLERPAVPKVKTAPAEPPQLSGRQLGEAFSRLLAELPPDRHQVTLARSISQTEMTRRLVEALRRQRRLSLKHFTRQLTNRLEAIVMFLSLLELIRQRQVSARQDRQFGEITLSYEAA